MDKGSKCVSVEQRSGMTEFREGKITTHVPAKHVGLELAKTRGSGQVPRLQQAHQRTTHHARVPCRSLTKTERRADRLWPRRSRNRRRKLSRLPRGANVISHGPTPSIRSSTRQPIGGVAARSGATTTAQDDRSLVDGERVSARSSRLVFLFSCSETCPTNQRGSVLPLGR